MQLAPCPSGWARTSFVVPARLLRHAVRLFPRRGTRQMRLWANDAANHACHIGRTSWNSLNALAASAAAAVALSSTDRAMCQVALRPGASCQSGCYIFVGIEPLAACMAAPARPLPIQSLERPLCHLCVYTILDSCTPHSVGAVRCLRPSSFDPCALEYERRSQWRRVPPISRHRAVPARSRPAWKKPERRERRCYKSRALPARRGRFRGTLSGGWAAGDAHGLRAWSTFEATWPWTCQSFAHRSIHGTTTSSTSRMRTARRDAAKVAARSRWPGRRRT